MRWRGALADRRGAAHCARAEALERRPLVGGDERDPEVVADQLVVVLGVGDRRLQQLASSHAPRDAACARGSRGPRRPTCRGCGRRPGAPCAPTCGRTWPGRGRPARGRRTTRRALGWARPWPAARRLGTSAASALRPRPSCRPSRSAPRARPLGLGRARSGFASVVSSVGGFAAAAARRVAFFARERRAGFFGGRLGLGLGRLGLLDVSGSSSAIATAPSRIRRDRGTGASARTRRACGRPSTR